MGYSLKAIVQRIEGKLTVFVERERGDLDLRQGSIDYLTGFSEDIAKGDQPLYVTLLARTIKNSLLNGRPTKEYEIRFNSPEESWN